MKGYKAFNRIGKKRKQGQCRNVVFKEGEVYELEGKPVLCENGYHFCKDLVLTFQYYGSDLSQYIFAEVEAVGELDHEQPTKHKSCTNKLKIVRFLSNKEVKQMLDSNGNSGNGNSGHRNSGDWNSGDWNSCDYETGFFNSEQPSTINVFNKPCEKEAWEMAKKPRFLYFDLDSDLGYKGSFKKAFESASEHDIELLKALPNFDAQVFFEISGIKLEGYDYE